MNNGGMTRGTLDGVGAEAIGEAVGRGRSRGSGRLLSRWETGFLVAGIVVLAVLVVRAVVVVLGMPPSSWATTFVYIAAVAAASLFRIRLGDRAGVPAVGAGVALLVITVFAHAPFAAAGVYGVGVFFGSWFLLRRAGLAAYAAAIGATAALAFLGVQELALVFGVPMLVAYPVSATAYVAVVLLVEWLRQRGSWARDGGVGLSGLRPGRVLAVIVFISGTAILLELVSGALASGWMLTSESTFATRIIVATAALLAGCALVRELRIVSRRLAGVIEAARRLPWDDVDDHEAYLTELASRTVGADAAELVDRAPESTEIGAAVLDADGERRWLIARRDLNQNVFTNADRNALDALAHIGSEVVRLRADVRDLERRARTDSLTGLPNYRAFHDALTLANEQRRHEGGIAVLYLDLDGFKALNEQHGHPFADRVMGAVAERIMGAVRADDLVARVGGDEFAVVIAPLASVEEGRTIAERVVAEVGRPFTHAGNTVQPRLSAGLAYSSERELDIRRLVDEADRTMLSVKHAAKLDPTASQRAGNVGVASPAASRIDDLVAAAVATAGFELAYQPIVTLVADQIWAFEALLRVCDTDGMPIAPDVVVERAIRLGVFDDLTRSIVVRALEAGRRFHEAERAVSCIAVNIEAEQMLTARLGGFFAEMVDEYPEVQLCLELNERSVSEVSAELREQVEALRARGVFVALDDYGSDRSSVASLVRVPMDILKIDRILADDLGDVAHAAVLRALQGFGDMLDYSMVVEGIENAETAAMLAAIGVRSAQGWYYGVPASAEATLERLRRHGGRAVLSDPEREELRRAGEAARSTTPGG